MNEANNIKATINSVQYVRNSIKVDQKPRYEVIPEHVKKYEDLHLMKGTMNTGAESQKQRTMRM